MRLIDIAALLLAISALVLGLSWCALGLWLASAVCCIVSLALRQRRALPIILIVLDALGASCLLTLVCTGFRLTIW